MPNKISCPELTVNDKMAILDWAEWWLDERERDELLVQSFAEEEQRAIPAVAQSVVSVADHVTSIYVENDLLS
ncbi:MAG: hypothetical protein HRU20_31385 [Pseudomonadales bacterium]|nr:hypothetical protein [Pseudomonadales bacterium]